MPARAEDWYKQASHDLQHAHHALESGDYEWACFAAQQACGKALKALYQKAGAEAWGHSVALLLKNLPPPFSAEPALQQMGMQLDKHYIPARYPNAYPEGAPYEFYTQPEAEHAIASAERIIRFCEDHLA